MIKVTTEGKRFPEFNTVINECIVALCPDNVDYDINIRFQKFADKEGSAVGYGTGDELESAIIIGTDWRYENDEVIA